MAIPIAINIKKPNNKKLINAFESFVPYSQLPPAIAENISSFLRKGVAGDWKNKFNKEAAMIFDHYAGDMLIKLGYETDHNWINKF